MDIKMERLKPVKTLWRCVYRMQPILLAEVT